MTKNNKHKAVRRDNVKNMWANFVFTEQQYYHNVPTRLKNRNPYQELLCEINAAKRDMVKFEAGDNIKLTQGKGGKKSVAINVRLSDDYEYANRHIEKEYTPKKGNTLDEVTKKLAQQIAENADTIDGETVDFGKGSKGKEGSDEFYM